MIKTALNGGYLRPYRFKRVIDNYLSSKINRSEYEKRLLEEISNVYKKMSEIGIEVVTDTLIPWDDIINISFNLFDGLDKGELIRFYENNFYYRTPIIKNKLKLNAENYIELESKIRDIASGYGFKEFKAVIPGPLTFTELSKNEFYNSKYDIIIDYINLLQDLLRLLKSNGVEFIEFHEPSLTSKESNSKLINFTIAKINEVFSTEKGVIISTYFYENNKGVKLLPHLKVEQVNIDLTEVKNINPILKDFKGRRKIGLGVVNSRDAKMEKISKLLRICKRVINLSLNEIYLMPSTFLDFLPEKVADRKLKLMVRAKYLCQGESR